MKKEDQYWFTNDYGECACLDFVGTYKQAERYAQKQADKSGEDIYINLGNDIVGVVFSSKGSA